MTGDTRQGLTEGERWALRQIRDGRPCIIPGALIARGYVYRTTFHEYPFGLAERYYLTDAGREVLSRAQEAG